MFRPVVTLRGFASLCAGRVTLRDPSHSDDIPKAQ